MIWTLKKPSVHQLLAAHFASTPLDELVVTRWDFPHWMRPDFQRTLETLFAGLPSHRFVGARMRDHELHFRFADLAEAGEKSIAVGPAVYQDVDIGEQTPVRCLTRGLWLAERAGVRFALLLDVIGAYRGVRAHVEVAVTPGAAPARLAAELVDELRKGAGCGACWRGKALVLEGAHDEFEISAAGLRVVNLVPVRREDIVLPKNTLALIERNTLGFARETQRLVGLGLSAKKGILLYGPPDTGKTLIVRWLAGALDGFTKLIVTADSYSLLAEYLDIARALQPALVVLEDVDLVGGHRDGPWAAGGGVLNKLLNEMDGLAREACVLFVLTTNRPEVLEPALAARPGRVDQAIEIGLPGEAERRLLIKRHAGGLRVPDSLAADAAKRTKLASAAFIKELMRRAAQVMLERGGDQELQPCDIEQALGDMLGAGGSLGARMLGMERAVGFAAAI